MFDLLPIRKKGMKDLTRFRSELDNLFDRFFDVDFPVSRELFKEGEWVPRVDVSEGKTDITVKAEIPGCDAKDIDVNLDGRMLTIRGEKKQEKEEKDENFHRVERSFGSFTRRLELPSDVQMENVDASYKGGILKIVLKKSQAAEGKKIEIKTK